jgi:hypothetical protein
METRMNSARGVFGGVVAVSLAGAALTVGIGLQALKAQDPWWFLVGLAMAVVSCLVVAYMAYRKLAHGADVTGGTLNMISRILALGAVIACVLFVLRSRT